MQQTVPHLGAVPKAGGVESRCDSDVKVTGLVCCVSVLQLLRQDAIYWVTLHNRNLTSWV